MIKIALHAMIARRDHRQRYRRAFEVVSTLPDEILDELRSSPKFKSAADLKLHYQEMRRFFPEMPEYSAKPKALVSMCKLLAE